MDGRLHADGIMLDTIVAYLHGNRVQFRLTSYPSEEPLPHAAHPIPPNAVLVDTEIVLVDGGVVLACFRAGDAIDYSALSWALGSTCIRGDQSDLPSAITGLPPPVPPFGQLFGLPLIVDETVNTGASIVVTPVFGGNDFLDLSFEDWMRLEAPRVASFASMGELREATASEREAPTTTPEAARAH